MIIGRFFPSCLFCVFGSDGWATLDDDSALILWLTGISKDLRLECRNVAIEFLELGGESTRLGFFAGLVVEKGRWRR